MIFFTMLDDFSLVQMVTEPTRHENVLDLFLTTNHTLVQKIEILPGTADHDIMVADFDIIPQVVTAQLMSTFVFATCIVFSLYFLNTKFQEKQTKKRRKKRKKKRYFFFFSIL